MNWTLIRGRSLVNHSHTLTVTRYSHTLAHSDLLCERVHRKSISLTGKRINLT